MIAIALRPSTGRKWGTVSFASTLHLCPILDLLLVDVPERLQSEIRLGLQEALVNAAKHGNNLDPNKTIAVQFFFVGNQYWWIISDQGSGFLDDLPEISEQCQNVPFESQERGRGLYILNQVFDKVQWDRGGTELRLCKQFPTPSRLSPRR
ncbi:MAG: anti-sigma regulatory factor [Synechococcales bacterium]|nr:anti-sigma regulatory factor [Synechococcales bacterium]